MYRLVASHVPQKAHGEVVGLPHEHPGRQDGRRELQQGAAGDGEEVPREPAEEEMPGLVDAQVQRAEEARVVDVEEMADREIRHPEEQRGPRRPRAVRGTSPRLFRERRRERRAWW